jgi:hypothetical protein
MSASLIPAVLTTVIALSILQATPHVVPLAPIAIILVRHQLSISAVQRAVPREQLPYLRPVAKDHVRPLLHISVQLHMAEDVVPWDIPVPTTANASQQQVHLQPSCQ